MAQVMIDSNDIVVFEGIAKQGKRAGQPYAFAKLDRRLSNNSTFVEAMKKAGAKVMTPGNGAVAGNQASFQIVG